MALSKASELGLNIVLQGESNVQKMLDDLNKSLVVLNQLSENTVKTMSENISLFARFRTAPFFSPEEFEAAKKLAIEYGTLIKTKLEDLDKSKHLLEMKKSERKELNALMNEYNQLMKYIDSSIKLKEKEEKQTRKANQAIIKEVGKLIAQYEKLLQVKIHKGSKVYKEIKAEREFLGSFYEMAKREEIAVGPDFLEDLRKKYRELESEHAKYSARYKFGEKERIDLMNKLSQAHNKHIRETEIAFKVEEYMEKIQNATTRSLGAKRGAVKALKDEIRSYIQSIRGVIAVDKDRDLLIRKILTIQKRYSTDTRVTAKTNEYLSKVEKSANLPLEERRRLYYSLRKEIAEYSKTLDENRYKYGPLSHALEKFRLILGRVFHALTSFFIVNNIQRIISGFVKSLFSSNQLLQEMRVRLMRLIPSSKELNSVWKKLSEFTITTPFKMQDFVEATALVRSFGLDAVKYLKSIADWASVTGEDIKETATAFAKVATYSPRTALLLSTRGISPALFEAYLIKYKNAAEALNNLISDIFGNTAKNISFTFKGVLTNLNDIYVLISKELGAPMFIELQGVLLSIYNVLNKISQSGEALRNFGIHLKNISYYAVTFVGLASTLFVITKLAQTISFIFGKLRISNVFTFGLYTAVVFATNLLFKLQALRGLQTSMSESIKGIAEIPYTKAIDKVTAIERSLELVNYQIDNIRYSWDLWLINLIKPGYLDNLIRVKNQLQEMREEAERLAKIQMSQKAIEAAPFTIKELYDLFGQSGKLPIELRKSLMKLRDELKREIAIPKIIFSEEDKVRIETEFNYLNAQLKTVESLLEYEGERKKIAIDLADTLIKQIKGLKGSTQEIASQKTEILETLQNIMNIYNSAEKASSSIEEIHNRISSMIDTLKGMRGEMAALISGEVEKSVIELQGLIKEVGIKPDEIISVEKYKETLSKIEDSIIKLNELKEKASIESTDALKSEIEAHESNIKQLEKSIKIYELIIQIIKEANNNLERYNDKVDNLNRSIMGLKDRFDELYSSVYTSNLTYLEGGISVSEYNKRLEDLRNKQKDVLDYIKSIGKLDIEDTTKSEATTEELTKQIDKLSNKYEYQGRYIELLKEEYNLLKELINLSDTFGFAIANYLVKLRSELKGFWSKVAEGIGASLEQAFTNIITSIVDRERYFKSIDDELENLRERLREVQARKLGIEIVKDEEVEILNRINELESKRSNIIKEQFDILIAKVKELAIEYAAKQIVSRLLGLISDETRINQMIELEKKLKGIRDESGSTMVFWSSLDLVIAKKRLDTEKEIQTLRKLNVDEKLINKILDALSGGKVSGEGGSEPLGQGAGGINININGDVYGIDSFERKVDMAMRKIDYKLIRR